MSAGSPAPTIAPGSSPNDVVGRDFDSAGRRNQRGSGRLGIRCLPRPHRSVRAGSDLTIPWSRDYGSLLELAEACDVPVRWSCRVGVLSHLRDDAHRGKCRLQPRPS
jgi:hypothetical protein